MSGLSAGLSALKTRDQRTRLIVFDWDGTLRDSVASIVGCALEALTANGLDSKPETIRSTIGLGLQESIAIWLGEAEPDAGGAAHVERVLESYRTSWIERWHARASLFPGVPEMLEELAESGYLLAVGTGKSRVGLRRDFDALDIEHRFASSRTADETAPKPSPEMLLQIMDELGASPGETLVIGDTTHDLLMAANARVQALGVLEGAMARSELEPLALDCLERVTDLTSWLRLRDRV